ncbi:MAG: type IV pili methyl-accepting chemotaxis transducer N-terminal domain-containing protein [Pseudomonadota bacterium]
MRACVILFWLSLLAAVGAIEAAAQAPLTAEIGQHERKINLARRQALYSQRLAKAACFAARGINRGSHLAQIRTLARLIDLTVGILVSGSKSLGIEPEQSFDVVLKLADVQAVWDRTKTAVETVLTTPEDGEIDRSALINIYADNVHLLHAMRTAFGTLEAKYTPSGQPPALMSAIYVASRQRMLAQKMGKELCLIADGFEPDRSRALLAGTIALFESAQASLEQDLAELNMPELARSRIQAQAQSVRKIWISLKPAFALPEGTGIPTRPALETVARENQKLLHQLNAALSLYESARRWPTTEQ